MAVPKKRKSHLKTRKKYTNNHIKNIVNRSIGLSEADIFRMLRRNEIGIPYYAISLIGNKWKRRLIIK
jgi:hypothetical protein